MNTQKQMNSSQIIYSEHDIDECFEYKNGSGRIPDGLAIGYLDFAFPDDKVASKLILFEDVMYSPYDHNYWNNYELENDEDRIVLG